MASEEHKRMWWQALLAARQGQIASSGTNVPAAENADHLLRMYTERFGDEDASPTVAYEGWAHLEIMGHRSHYGYVREVRSYGTKLIEVKVLDKDGEDFATVHQYGGGAIFSLQMLDEEKCRHGARGEELHRCRHTNDQGDRDCAKMVWSQSVYEAYCEEHKREESGDDSSNIPW